MVVRVLLVDREAPARRHLQQVVTKEPDLAVVGECATSAEAKEAIRTLSPDVVLWGNVAADGDQGALLAALAANPHPLLVRTTPAGSPPTPGKTASTASLPKPLSAGRLRKLLAPIRSKLAPAPATLAPVGPPEAAATHLKRFVVRLNDRLLIVPANDVDWMESANNYIVLHAGREAHVLRDTLSNLDQRLSPDQFVRVSRFAIVNLDRVREIHSTGNGDYSVLLTTGTEVPVTRSIRELQERLERT